MTSSGNYVDVIKNRIAKDAEIKVEHNEVIGKTKTTICEQFGMAASATRTMTGESIADNFLKGEGKTTECVQSGLR